MKIEELLLTAVDVGEAKWREGECLENGCACWTEHVKAAIKEVLGTAVSACPQGDLLATLKAINEQLECPARNTNRGYRYAEATVISSDLRKQVKDAIAKCESVSVSTHRPCPLEEIALKIHDAINERSNQLSASMPYSTYEPPSKEFSDNVQADILGILHEFFAAAPVQERKWKFNRYRNGKLMAEGAEVHAANFDEALQKAKQQFSEYGDGNIAETDEFKLAQEQPVENSPQENKNA